jgi:hypothetical protein
MQPTRILPEEFHSVGTFDLRSNPQALIRLNIFGFILFALSGWFFVAVLAVLRPAEARAGISFGFASLGALPQTLLGVLLVMAAMIVLHEAVHGIFFWGFTRSKPLFAFKWAYAYAAAPDWYLPKFQYLAVALAPLVLLSLAGIALMAVVPQGWFMALVFFLVMNAGGAVGDLWVVGWLLRQPNACYANDHGDAVTLFIKS